MIAPFATQTSRTSGKRRRSSLRRTRDVLVRSRLLLPTSSREIPAPPAFVPKRRWTLRALRTGPCSRIRSPCYNEQHLAFVAAERGRVFAERRHADVEQRGHAADAARLLEIRQTYSSRRIMQACYTSGRSAVATGSGNQGEEHEHKRSRRQHRRSYRNGRDPAPAEHFLTSISSGAATELEALDSSETCGRSCWRPRQALLRRRQSQEATRRPGGRRPLARRGALYHEARRLVATKKPIVAAVHGARSAQDSVSRASRTFGDVQGSTLAANFPQ